MDFTMSIADVYTENEQDKCVFSDEMEETAVRVINKVLEQEGFGLSCEVSLLITDNENIRMLNAEHRGKDTATDVLSFPMLEFDALHNIISGDDGFDDGTLLLGDIVISLERAYSQAEEYGHTPLREISFLCAHSTLHLLGYDHEADEESRLEMREKEEKALSALGITR